MFYTNLLFIFFKKDLSFFSATLSIFNPILVQHQSISSAVFANSFISASATLNPLPEASRAIATPFTPPPMTKISYIFLILFQTCVNCLSVTKKI